MRIWLKRLGIICLIPIVLLLLVSVLLYVPPIQNVVIKKAMKYVSEATEMVVDFERLRLSFPLGISVHNVIVFSSDVDTLFRMNKLTLDVKPRPLLKGNVIVEGLTMEAIELNTGTLIDGIVVKGRVGGAYLSAGNIETVEERALLNSVSLSDANVDLFYCDTTVSDTTTSKINWCIDLKKAELKNVNFVCRMPCDSVFLDIKVNGAVLSDGFVDLGMNEYSVSGLSVNMSKFFYATDLGEAAPGLDFSHILLSDLSLKMDSLYYDKENNISAILRECFAKERSGLVVKSATGRFEAGNANINIPSFLVETDYSTIQLQAYIPWTSIDEKNPAGKLSINTKASIDKHDALLIIGNNSEAFCKYYPDTMFTFEMIVTGNTGDFSVNMFDAVLPGAFDMSITGNITSLLNERVRTGTLDCTANTQDLDFIAGMFPDMLQNRFRIPDNITFAGNLTMDKGLYSVEMMLKESLGTVSLTGNYDVFNENYEALMNIDSLEPVHFLPGDSVMWLSASVNAKGQGSDFFHSSTWSEINGTVNNIRYGESSVSDISLVGSLKNNHLKAELNSAYPYARGRLLVDGEVRKDKVKGMIIADVDSLDLFGLKLVETPMSSSFQIFTEVESDLEKIHSLDVTLGNWTLALESQTVEPKMLTLAFRSDTNITKTSFYAGDLNMVFTGNADIINLTDNLSQLYGEVEKQVKRDSTVDFQELRPYFPDMTLQLSAERDNPIYNYLQADNIFFEKIFIDAAISPEDGLKVNGSLLALVKDTFKIDTVGLNVWQDTLGIIYNADVVKNRFRNQDAFKANVAGYVHKNDGDIFLSYIDNKGEKGINLGVNIKKVNDRFDFNFYPEKPVIAFLPFTVNNNNYFRFRSLKDMEANIRLDGASNSSFWIHSGDESEDMKEMMVELNRIDLEKISSGFFNLPSLKGLLNATFRYVPDETSFMIIADGNIEELYYENGRIGELLVNATYMPMEKGTHQVDMHAFHDMKEISSLSVLYKEGRYENKIDGAISISQLPLNLFDAMIPEQMVRLNGSLNGDFTVKGTDTKPVVNGALKVDDGTMFVVPSSTTLHIDNKDIKMTNNKITFDKFLIYSQKENPFIIEGTVNAANTSRPDIDLRMSASNMQLISTNRTRDNIVFGRLNVNINSTLRGTLQSMRMRGSMRILGTSNLTYIMPDSPLEVQDNFNNLITFTYFADTLPRRARSQTGLTGRSRNSAAVSGMDATLTINIEPAVRVRIELDEAQSNFVELRGGGDLSLRYNAQGDMSLSGRYTLSDGTIRYSIPVIPLTDFSIRSGSFVDWSGNIMNPYLNIAAYTRASAFVRSDDGQSRTVDFNTGIQLRDNLEDVTVKFLLEAPTDAVIQNQLTSMSEEERGKQAASLLVTGVYLSSGERGRDNLDVGMALNSLLQRELKNMLGSMFGDIPFMFDVNMYDGTQGDKGSRVDYILRFFKGFYNERLNTAMGLRYTTKDPVFGDQFFLNNISAEYMIDADGSRSIRAYRSKDYENIFEGEIGKIGASFSVRRKVKRLKDLFLYNKREIVVVERRGPVRREEENTVEVNKENVEEKPESVK